MRYIFYLLIAVMATVNAVAQTSRLADTTKLDKKLSILNDKYILSLPAEAVNSPRVADIMAADPNINKETRIIVDNGTMRLVLFAQELFALGGNKLFEDISKEIEPEYDFQRKIFSESDSLLLVLSTPTRFDTAINAILVNSLLVKSPDNTVSRIDAYINPEAYTIKDDYTQLAEKIFRTIAKGNRRIHLNAKNETYTIAGTTSKFQFSLPKNYFVTVDEKYDFSVFKVNKYKNNVLDSTYAAITIYTGKHPSLFHKEYGYTEDNAAKTKGSFLQQPLEWLYFKDDEQHFYLKEQVIPTERIDKGIILHAAVLTNRKELVDELSKIVEGIKLLQ